jgi:hypothetical protein
MNLYSEFCDWLHAYIPDKGERQGIAYLMAKAAYKHSKVSFTIGFFIGIFVTIGALRYFA